MHINDLPYDVLVLVFQEALPMIQNQVAGIKRTLRLLSVCRAWREIALPMVYDTVFIKCGARGASSENGPESVAIETTLDLAAKAGCLHVTKRLVIDVHFQASSFPGLEAVIERLRGVADEWAGVRKLELGLHPVRWTPNVRSTSVVDHADAIVGITSALAALIPGLREIKFSDTALTQVTSTLLGQLVELYAKQLQVLHSKSPITVSQDRVFPQLRDVKFEGQHLMFLSCQLPRLDPRIVECLVLDGFTANTAWSMFCTDTDSHAVTFPRVTHLRVVYPSRFSIPGQTSEEHPWALHFPAAKHVHVVCDDATCHSLENAVFPAALESLNLLARSDVLKAFARAKVQVSETLALAFVYRSDVHGANFDAVNRIFSAAGNSRSKKLLVDNICAIPLELFTYTELTHLQLCGPVTVDGAMGLIRRHPQLVSLSIRDLSNTGIQTDFSIPASVEHEQAAPLDSQIRKLALMITQGEDSAKAATSMLKYLLLKIPTLERVVSNRVPIWQLKAFTSDYAQWYPHLAHVKLLRSTPR